MRSFYFRLPCLVAIFIIDISFLSNSHFSVTAKTIQQNLARVNDTLYVSKFETSNEEYNSFLFYIKEKEPERFSAVNIDTAGWSGITDYSTPLTTYYHRHPAYKNYPVVNISYEAAIAYCSWLTAQYNADPKRKFKKVHFFLPSEELWMTVAGNGDKSKMYPWNNYYLRDKNGMFLCNFRIIGDQRISYDTTTKSYKVIPLPVEGGLNDRAVYTSPVNSYPPGPFGIYNFSGNVAEMVAQKGVAKGGSYHSAGFDVRIQSSMNYTNSSPEVGFRVFMNVLEP